MANYKNINMYLPAPDTDEKGAIHTADAILQASDWTQIPNNGLTDACVTAFNEYRTAIRIIRQTNPDNPTWPDAPDEEWS